jgi:hypothetical protein
MSTIPEIKLSGCADSPTRFCEFFIQADCFLPARPESLNAPATDAIQSVRFQVPIRDFIAYRERQPLVPHKQPPIHVLKGK